jgi:hypothetical protein
MEHIFCPECGFKNEIKNKFCPGCGAKIAEMPMQEIKAINVMPENRVEKTTNRILMPDGAIYEGELNDGIANGYGKYFYPKPDGFEGLWMEPSEDRLVYEGIFLNGKKHGFGKLSNIDYNYEGNWELNQKSGFGKETIKWWGKITEYVGNFSNDKKNGTGTLREFCSEGEKIINPYNFEGSFCQDKFEEGLLTGSFLGTPPTYSIRYKGTFAYIDEIEIYLLDMFPAFDGELIFTWLETGKSSKHIVKLGKSESYDLMREEAYEDNDDDDDDEDNYYYDDDDSPIKPKDGAGLR